MKHAITTSLFCLFMVIGLSLFSQVSSAEDTILNDESLRTLIGAMKDSIESKKQDEFVGLIYYATQTSQKFKENDKKTFEILTKPKTRIKDITFAPLTFDINQGYVADCMEFKPTLTVIGYIKIDYERDVYETKEEASIKIPFGEKDGKYLLASVSSRPVDKNAPNSFVVIVSGTVDFEGYCLHSSVGGDIREDFSGNESKIVRFCGESIIRCEAHSLSNDGHVALQIIENGQDLFKTEQTTKGQTITFEPMK